MKTTISRVAMAILVVGAMIGAAGLVSGELNVSSPDDDPQNNYMAHITDHMGSDVTDHMYSHSDETMNQIMQDHMQQPNHTDHHDSAGEHCV